MAIAFGGLFLAGEPAMNQLAFFFVTSVLVDTFFPDGPSAPLYSVPLTVSTSPLAVLNATVSNVPSHMPQSTDMEHEPDVL